MPDPKPILLRSIDAVRRPALATIVEERMREAIMFGELALGEAVSEDKLATRLGVSRTPVREALTALQRQGLISIQPQRGSYVFLPTDQDIAEICEFRALIECRAMKLAMARDREATVALLVAAEGSMEAAEQTGDATAAARADADFHTAFIEQAGNRLLAEAYMLVSGQVGAIRYLARRSSGARSYSSAQHREIIAAFKAGDLEAADRVMTEHVMNMRVHFNEAQKTLAKGTEPVG